jgi:hypothetical protein
MERRVKKDYAGDESARYAVLVTDMLNDFIYGELKSRRAKAIIPKVKLLLDLQ